MIALSQILDLHCVELSLDAKKKDDAVRKLVNLLAASDKTIDVDEVARAILEREKSVSTGIGGGVAIPHARISGISRSHMAIGKKKQGIAFGALDKRPVTLIFLIITPENEELTQLNLLSKLARFLRNRDFKKALLRAEKPEDVMTAIKGIEEQER